MKITWEDIQKVLAMFDEEDIKYIDFGYLNSKFDIIDNKEIKHNPKIKAKKLGGKDDKRRK